MRNESRNKIFEPFGILFPDFIESIIRSGNELDHYIFPHYISRNREKTYDRPYDDYVKNWYLFTKLGYEIDLDSFIVKMHYLIEKEGLDWVDQHFDQSLLFEKLNTFFWETRIIYFFFYELCMCKDGLACVCSFRKDCEKLCSLDERQRIKKFDIVFKNFSDKKIENFLSKMEKETPLVLDNYKKALELCEKKKEGININLTIKSFTWLLIQDKNLPRLPNSFRTPKIEEFLIRKRRENKKQYDNFCFREEKKRFLKELAQKENDFWRRLGKGMYNSNILNSCNNDLFSFYRKELQVGKPAFTEEEKLKKDSFWRRLNRNRDWIEPEEKTEKKLKEEPSTKEVVPFTSKRVFPLYRKELETGKLAFIKDRKTPNTLFQIAFKKLAEKHGPSSKFFRNYILNTCFWIGKTVPEEEEVSSIYADDDRLCLTREGFWSLEANYQINQRIEQMLFHYNWCRTCIGHPFLSKGTNSLCPYENSEVKIKVGEILATWKKREEKLAEGEIEDFNVFFTECSWFGKIGRLYEKVTFDNENEKGVITISFGLNIHQFNQGYLNYLKKQENIKKLAFIEVEQLVSKFKYLEASFDRKISKYLTRSEKNDVVPALRKEYYELIKQNVGLEEDVSYLTKTCQETQQTFWKALTELEEKKKDLAVLEETKEELFRQNEKLSRLNVELEKNIKHWIAVNFSLLSKTKIAAEEEENDMKNVREDNEFSKPLPIIIFLGVLSLSVFFLLLVAIFRIFNKNLKKSKK